MLQAMAVRQLAPPAVGHDEAEGDSDSDTAQIVRLAALQPADETQLLYSLCLHGRGELGLASDEYAALTMVLLRLLAFQPPRAMDHAAGPQAPEKKTLNEPIAAPSEPVAASMADTGHLARPAPATATESVPPGQHLQVRMARQGSDSVPNRAVMPVDIARAATKIVAVPVRAQPPAGPREAQVQVDPSNAEAVVTSAEGDFWHALVTQLVQADAVRAMARELALQSQLVARDEGHWLLRVESESLNQGGNRERLQTALAGLGHAVTLAVEVGPVRDSPARRIRHAAQARQLAAEQAIRNDPEVQALMRDFGARIVPGSLRPL